MSERTCGTTQRCLQHCWKYSYFFYFRKQGKVLTRPNSFILMKHLVHERTSHNQISPCKQGIWKNYPSTVPVVLMLPSHSSVLGTVNQFPFISLHICSSEFRLWTKSHGRGQANEQKLGLTYVLNNSCYAYPEKKCIEINWPPRGEQTTDGSQEWTQTWSACSTCHSWLTETLLKVSQYIVSPWARRNRTHSRVQYLNELWRMLFIIELTASNVKQMETNSIERIPNVPLARLLDQPEALLLRGRWLGVCLFFVIVFFVF